jgi:hypothetical protein
VPIQDSERHSPAPKITGRTRRSTKLQATAPINTQRIGRGRLITVHAVDAAESNGEMAACAAPAASKQVGDARRYKAWAEQAKYCPSARRRLSSRSTDHRIAWSTDTGAERELDYLASASWATWAM